MGPSKVRGGDRLIGPLVGTVVLVVVVGSALIVWLAAGFGGDDGTQADQSPGSVTFDGRIHTVEIQTASGEGLATTFHPASSPSRPVLVAASSRNADETSLAPLVVALTDQDCVSIVTFDARPLTSSSPLDAYLAVLADLGRYGVATDEVATLGASFTALSAVLAADQTDATRVIALSPSEQAPGPPPVGVDALLIGARDDSGFVAVFDQWTAAGFRSVSLPVGDHGTAIFEGAAAADAIELITAMLCPT